jgi:phosphodiesterase/alkaline phosphatase D-like protein
MRHARSTDCSAKGLAPPRRRTVTGLTPGQVYYFRFSAQTRKGPVDVSQTVSLMVH